MISAPDATEVVFNTPILKKTESLSLDECLGRHLAEEVNADRDFPPYNRVTMDGICLRYSPEMVAGKILRIEAMQFAGDPQLTLKDKDGCIEIMTGAVCPEGADAVIRYEDLKITELNGIRTAKLLVDAVESGQNIHPKGLDRKEGTLLIPKGKVIGPPEIAVAASVGMSKLKVAAPPKIAIISTGNELVNVDRKPLPHQIRHSNVHMIKSALKDIRLESDWFHLLDSPQKIKSKLSEILTRYDVVIMSGGVSKGKADHVPGALDALGVTKLFHRIAQRPGKPFWFGKAKNGTVVFALPGNPVSTFMCFTRYLKPWIIKQTTGSSLPKRNAVLSGNINFKPDLTYFAQVKVSHQPDGWLSAWPVEGHGSGDLANLMDCNAFIELPRGKDFFQVGESYPIWPFRRI